MFYIGCPLWGYKEWVGNFFPAHTPASDFLKLYSRKLTAVEGNTIFYALPSTETIARWCEETPSTFRICPKVLRSISHEGQLEQKRDETLQFVERMQELGERLGPAFLQLPPAFGPAQLTQLEAFLGFWPADTRLAIEVRHPGYFEEHHAATLNTLLSQYNVARVMMDTRPLRVGPEKEQRALLARERKPGLPVQVAATTDFAFIRYIGHPRMEVNQPFLDSWAQHISQWLQQDMTVYAFCHCPYTVYTPGICAALYQRVSTLVPLPPLTMPEEPNDDTIQQQRLF